MPSATVIFLVSAPLVSDYCNKSGKSPAAGLFSACLVSITSAGALPIGIGTANYITVNSQMAAYGFVGYGIFLVVAVRMLLLEHKGQHRSTEMQKYLQFLMEELEMV